MWVWVVPSDMSYCLTWCGRSDACAMTRGEVICHPGGVAAVRSPVFRHAGSWRHAGTVRRASHQSHPGGGAGLSRPPWHVSCCVSMLCVAITACHHLRGGILGRPSAVPACRRHPGRRNTGLRTAATPRGVAKMSASGHRLRRWRWGRRCAAPGGATMGRVVAASAESHEVACLILTLHLRSCAGVAAVINQF